MAKPASAKHFRSCPSCRGRGELEITVQCPECQGEGQIGPLYSAAKNVLAAYQLLLDHDDGLDIMRDALTDLQEALDGKRPENDGAPRYGSGGGEGDGS